jgi:hypothetical protein
VRRQLVLQQRQMIGQLMFKAGCRVFAALAQRCPLVSQQQIVPPYDLLVWLLPRTQKFPADQRFVITKRLQDAALDFQEALFDANALAGSARLLRLQQSDAHLNKLRLYLRLAHTWTWLSTGQHEFVSKHVAELGRLLGGWIRQTKRA